MGPTALYGACVQGKGGTSLVSPGATITGGLVRMQLGSTQHLPCLHPAVPAAKENQESMGSSVPNVNNPHPCFCGADMVPTTLGSSPSSGARSRGL